MIVITLLIVVFALPQIDWAQRRLGPRCATRRCDLWHGFVYIVLALSGVEAIANLTGVMKKPVFHTARKAIWLVAVEVAVFNLLLALVMIALASPPPDRDAHTEDMLAFLAGALRRRRGASGRSASSAGCCCCRRRTPPSTG